MREMNKAGLLERARIYAVDYVETVRDRPVFPDKAALEGLKAFDGPMPEEGLDPFQMLELLHGAGTPATVSQSGGRYFGFVNGGLHPPALAARWLADAWDQNGAIQATSPVAAKLEELCEEWLVSLFGLPESTVAGFVTGTSTSLTCGFAAARDELLRRQGWNAGEQGLFGAPEVRVVLSEQAHGTVFKSLALLGLGGSRVHKVPCDDQGRMRAELVPELDDNTLLVLAAGNVNSGAFDPIEELCEKARAAGSWVHIDGAFGLWAAASPRTASLCEGMAQADSWSADAHKTLNSPYDCGIIFCRDGAALSAALQAAGPYIQWSDQREGMRYTPEMSRRARGIDLWATLVTMGRSGVAALVDRLCSGARYFASGLEKEGFPVLNDVVFNQVLTAGETAEETAAIMQEIQGSGECWCGGSAWRGQPVIRVSVCGAETTKADIDRSIAAFVRARYAVRQDIVSL